MRIMPTTLGLAVCAAIIDEFPNAIYRICNRSDAMYIELTLYYNDDNGVQVQARISLTAEEFTDHNLTDATVFLKYAAVKAAALQDALSHVVKEF